MQEQQEDEERQVGRFRPRLAGDTEGGNAATDCLTRSVRENNGGDFKSIGTR